MRVGLQNLVGISLEQITPAPDTIKRLLDAAARHIADAKVDAISGETRFASAYTAIRMLADVGLHAHGYRTLTSKPGHLKCAHASNAHRPQSRIDMVMRGRRRASQSVVFVARALRLYLPWSDGA
jgi:hypothetical protein